MGGEYDTPERFLKIIEEIQRDALDNPPEKREKETHESKGLRGRGETGRNHFGRLAE